MPSIIELKEKRLFQLFQTYRGGFLADAAFLICDGNGFAANHRIFSFIKMNDASGNAESAVYRACVFSQFLLEKVFILFQNTC